MDDGEKKRSLNIVPMAGLLAILIIIIVLLFLIKGCTKRNNNEGPSEPSCKIVYSRETDKGNIYTSPVEVSVEATASKNATIVTKNVGVEENGRRNRETYVVSSNGETTLIGYVEDSKGKTATCTSTVQLELVVPTCEIEIKEGKQGESGWYISPVTIEFKDVDTNSEAEVESKTFEIAKKSGGATKRSSEESYTIESDGKYLVTGTITDSYGNEGTCTIDVNIDTKEPTCSLKKTKEEVASGSPINVEIEFDKYEDETGKVSAKGIGLTEDYETETYKITKRGNFEVTGYVKDEAGNKGTCSIKVDTKTNTEPLSVPTCEFKVEGEKHTDNKSYCGNVTLVLDNKTTTNGATITGFGIGTLEDYNNYKEKNITFLTGKDKITLGVVKETTDIEYYGMVEDSNGEIGICSIKTKVYPECVKKPKCELYQKSSYTANNNVIQVVVGFKESGTYAQDGLSIVKYGLSYSNNNELNDKKELAVNKPGKHTIYGFVKDSNGVVGSCGPLEITINNTNYDLLSKVVKVGDSVNYDAGKWETTAPIPTSQGTFGGYTAGNSKSKGVLCFDLRHTPKDGWVVLSNNNGVVKITTRGIPECYYHGVGVDGNISISLINNEAKKFMNNEYASSVSIMNYEEANAIYNNHETADGYQREMYEKLLFAGDYYYLSTKGDNNGKKLETVRFDFGSKYVISERSGYAHGIRPVVTLKNNLYTTGEINGVYELVSETTGSKTFVYESESLIDRVVKYIDEINF